MKRTELRRSTPLRSTVAKPRRKPAVTCDWSARCHRRPSVIVSEDERLCKTHATAVADRLVGDAVRARDGRCMLRAASPELPCFGEQLFWCHLIPKGAHPAIRWEPLNTVAGCRDHHMAFDRSEVFRDLWRDEHLGAEVNAELKRRSVTGSRPDVAEVIRRYRQEAA